MNIIEIYEMARLMAIKAKQIVGENREYYITIEQLEKILMTLKENEANK